MNKRLIASIVLVALFGCEDSESSSQSAVNTSTRAGEDVYRNRIRGGNSFTCATCHALSEPTADGFRRAGHPIGDAVARPTFKNGQVSELRAAVNSCVEEWMAAEPLAESDEDWVALRDFLQTMAPATANPLTFTIKQPPQSLMGGDPGEGQNIFNHTCASCHGVNGVGTEQAPAFFGTELSREVIARRVRTSGSTSSRTYTGLTGGRMPFWAEDRLSDAELLHVVAYVEMLAQQEPPQATPVDAGTPDAGSPGTGSPDASMQGCGMNHPRVGQCADFRRFAHRVAGTVCVVDDCTLQIENFSYDGQGIDVRIYGGRDGEFDPPTGFPMSEDLLGRRFNNESYTVHIPPGKTLDDFNSISVWCVDVSQDFGNARFPDL